MSQSLNFLNPNSVAIIGASKDPTKRGFRAIQTLLQEKFAGAIFPINPKESEILGLPCHPDLASVPQEIDLALICTPARTLPAMVKACGEKGVKGAVVLAGGFSEAGEEGTRLEQEMVAAARQFGVRLVGPNTSGMFNTHKACNLVGFSNLEAGGIGILSQSGNMALSLVTEGQINGHMGFSTYIGVGNEADLQFSEYLDYFGDDEQTKVVIAYVEGLKNGHAFLESARRVCRIKPVVLYKSGRTEVGQSAAKSHTGALAGSYGVARGALQQAGVTVVSQSDQILSVAEALALLPPPPSKRIAILADGGGHATIAADALTEQGMTLPRLSQQTRERLAAILPPAAALANPVDVAGGTDANPEVFADCAEAILADPSIDALLIVGLFGGYAIRFSETLGPIESHTASRLGGMIERFGKPIMLQSLYAPMRTESLVTLRAAGVPVHESVERAVRCLVSLAEYGAARARIAAEQPAAAPAANTTASTVVSAARSEGRNSLLEHEAQALLKSYAITLPPSVLVSSPAELGQARDQLGEVPLAMKVVSRDILHKSDAGAVKLNVVGESEMSQAYAAIVKSSLAYRADADIKGVLVTPMARKGGVEMIIGVTRDPQFGPVMMFGLGGIFVEVLKDVVFRSLPLTAIDAAEMLDEIKAKAILGGVRGAPPVDRKALVDLMLRISQVCLAHPEIAELDLNPILGYADGYALVDARMILG
ncbi:MAG: acetate--CoA ligase family protein [Gammaproteobacteria bacterium]|nr:acetate--CoA ligase family protein [Gammaproteobacteria bacterium]